MMRYLFVLYMNSLYILNETFTNDSLSEMFHIVLVVIPNLYNGLVASSLNLLYHVLDFLLLSVVVTIELTNVYFLVDAETILQGGRQGSGIDYTRDSILIKLRAQMVWNNNHHPALRRDIYEHWSDRQLNPAEVRYLRDNSAYYIGYIEIGGKLRTVTTQEIVHASNRLMWLIYLGPRF